MAARVLASQGRPTWLYSFDHTPYESVNEGRISSYLGAFHGRCYRHHAHHNIMNSLVN